MACLFGFKTFYSLLIRHKLRSESNFDVNWLSAELLIVLNWNLTLIYSHLVVEASLDPSIIKRINHLHPTPYKITHISRSNNQLVFLRCGCNQHIWGAAGDALGL